MGGGGGEGREVAARKVGGGEGGKGGEGEERGGGGGGCVAGRGTERRSESERTPRPIDARVVPGQPWEPQHELEVAQSGHLEGKFLGMGAMDTDAGREVVGDKTSRGCTAVDKL